jgi:hypothetical protein
MDWPGADDFAKRVRKMIPPELLEGELDEEEQQQQQARAQAQQGQQAMIDAQVQTDLAEKASKTELNFAKAKETLSKIDQQELANLMRVLQVTSGRTGNQ